MSEPTFGAWQPIETAPKDGTSVLAFWPDAYGDSNATITQTWYGPKSFFEPFVWNTAYDYSNNFSYPTHWMPLPPAPEGEG